MLGMHHLGSSPDPRGRGRTLAHSVVFEARNQILLLLHFAALIQINATKGMQLQFFGRCWILIQKRCV